MDYTLAGEYSDLITYEVGNAVINPVDGFVYYLRKAAPAGTPCTDTLYWQRVDDETEISVKLATQAIDIAFSNDTDVVNNLTTSTAGSALDAVQGKALNEKIKGYFPNSKTLVLASSTEESTKTFAITVTDDGTLTATEIV